MLFWLPALAALCCGARGQEPVYRFERFYPVLQQPWYFFRPEGVAIDAAGAIYVADTANHRIRKFTRDGQFVLQWGRFGSAPGQFDVPSGIAFGGGLIYVADTNNGRIQAFSANGAFVRGWPTHRTPTGAAVDPVSGDLLVTYGDALRVERYSAAGALLDAFVGSNAPVPGVEGCAPDPIPCGWSPAVAVDADRNVFVTDVVRYQILKLSPALDVISAFGADGQPIGGAGISFGPSFGLVVDASGNVYASDFLNDRIHQFDNAGNFTGLLFGDRGNNLGNFGGPGGLAMDDRGLLYVADAGNDRIQVLTPNGRPLAQLGSLGKRNGAFDGPSDIAIGPGGVVYVVDTENYRVQKFDRNGGFLLAWGSEGREHPGLFVRPAGIAAAPDGTVYVADTQGPRVQRFTSEGEFLLEWGSFGPGEGQFGDVSGIAVDRHGNVYVTDFPDDGSDRHRVQKFTADGTFLRMWGRFGAGDGEFYSPVAIAVDNDDFVYVVENGSLPCPPGSETTCPAPNTPPRVQKFTADGDFVLSWGGYGTQPGRFDQPSGIAIGPDGNIFVSDAVNGRVQVFTPAGEFVQQFSGRGDSPGQLLYPAGIDVAPNGTVLVADRGHDRIQEFAQVLVTERNKAVLLSGGGLDHRLSTAARMCVNFAYRALIYQGLAKEDLRYLGPDPEVDLDSNGFADDILPASIATLEDTLTNWAADADNVLIYIAAPGLDDQFQINTGEFVDAAALNQWLDALEYAISGSVLLVYDGSRSGSFLDELSGGKGGGRRIVITSTSATQSAYFVSTGTLSFSNRFWLGVFSGNTLAAAFEQARKFIGGDVDYQSPQLDANRNGIANEAEDLQAAGRIRLFREASISDEAPEVGRVSPAIELAPTETAAAFFAENVTDDQETLSRVWGVVLPPQRVTDGREVLNLPTVDFARDQSGVYRAEFDGFTDPGQYFLDIYALDGNLNITPPARVAVAKATILAATLVVTIEDVSQPGRPRVVNALVTLEPIGLTVSNNINGVYSFVAVPEGVYTVRVTAPGFQEATQPVTLSGGDSRTLLFSLNPSLVGEGEGEPSGTGTLRVTVLNGGDAARPPVLNATVRVNPAGLVVTANTSGEYVVENVPEGTWTVRVTAAGFAAREQSVVMTVDGDVAITVTLEAKGGCGCHPARARSGAGAGDAAVALLSLLILAASHRRKRAR